MLIVVHGMIGAGKTTLARKLSRDLKISLLSQDSIKEFYADELNRHFSEIESKALGRAAKFSLVEVARELTGAGVPLVIEGAFHADTAQLLFAGINTRTALVVQVSVICEFDVARARFEQRIADGERHPVHTGSVFSEFSKEEILHKYRPLDMPGIVTVTYDTTDGHDGYKQLLHTLRESMNGQHAEEVR